MSGADEPTPDRRRNTPIARSEAERRFTTCCLCGDDLPPERIYVCARCEEAMRS
jgi:hypothetical protein